MSWSIKKVGTLKDALKASIQADTGIPSDVRDEICARIDDQGPFDRRQENGVEPGKAIFVESYGHVDELGRPYRNVDTILILVQIIPLIDTPL